MALSRRAGITAGILEFERRMRDTHFGQIVFHGRLHPALFFGRIYHHMRGQRTRCLFDSYAEQLVLHDCCGVFSFVFPFGDYELFG